MTIQTNLRHLPEEPGTAADSHGVEADIELIAPSDQIKETQENGVKAFENLQELTEELVVTKSVETSRIFLQRLGKLCLEAAQSKSGQLDHDSLVSLVSEIEEVPNLEELQERALEALEKMGAISFSPEGMIIAHLDQLRSINSEKIRKLGPIHSSNYYGQGQLCPSLYYTFKDRQVISEEDYLADKREGKTLFYSPRNEEEAFDTEQIKQADFYLGLWETTKTASPDRTYPSTEEGLDFSEVALACTIYHPKYGNGYRDKDGKLVIYDQESEKYRPVSSGRLFRGALGLKKGAESRPAEYAMKHLPNLNLSGLLTPDDFMVRPALSVERPYYVKRKIATGGAVMIDNIQYYIGKSKKLKEAEVYKLSDKIAVVAVNGEIQHTFNLLDTDSPEIKAQSQNKKGTVYYRTSKEGTNLTAFDRSTFSERLPDETEQEYEARTIPIENFELWSKLNRVFGPQNSLVPFRSMELEPGQARALLNLFEQLDPQVMAEITEIYRNIVKSVREIGNFIRDNVGANRSSDRSIQNTVRRMMKKSLDLLLRYSENPPTPPENAVSELNNLQSEINLFTSVFKGLREDKQPIRLEDFVKFQSEVSSGMQIIPEDADKMRQLIIQNRLERPDIIEQAVSEFDAALKNPDSNFHLLEYDNEIVGFFRVDSMGELDAYLGSLNVPPNIQGSGIGDEVLKNYFTDALAGRIGHASADPRNPITPLYIGRYNFVGSAIKPFGDTDQPYIELTLNPQLNSELHFFNTPDDNIVSSYISNKFEIGVPVIILRFQESESEGLMQESNNILSSGLYVMSAYRKIIENDKKYIYSVFELNPATSSTRAKAA